MTAALPARSSLQSRPTMAAIYAVVALVCIALIQVPSPVSTLALAIAVAAVVYCFPGPALVAYIPLAVLSRAYLNGTTGVAMPMALAGVWVLGVLTRRWRLRPLPHLPIAALAALVAISGVSTPSLLGRVGLVEILVVLTLGAVAGSVRPPIPQVLVGIGLAGLLAAFAILTGTMNGQAANLNPTTYTRAVTLANNPNELAMLLCLGMVAWAGLAFDRRSPVLAIPLIPLLAAVPATQSREVLAYGLIGLMVLLFVRRGTALPIVVVAAVAVLLFAKPTLPDTIYAALLGDRVAAPSLAYGDQDRLAIAALGLRTGLENPVLGVGFNNFQVIAAGDPSNNSILSTHNEYLRLFAEAGAAALVAIVALVATGLWAAFRRREQAALAVLAVYAAVLLIANPLMNIGVSAGVLILMGTLCAGGSEDAPPEKRVDPAEAAPGHIH